MKSNRTFFSSLKIFIHKNKFHREINKEEIHVCVPMCGLKLFPNLMCRPGSRA